MKNFNVNTIVKALLLAATSLSSAQQNPFETNALTGPVLEARALETVTKEREMLLKYLNTLYTAMRFTEGAHTTFVDTQVKVKEAVKELDVYRSAQAAEAEDVGEHNPEDDALKSKQYVERILSSAQETAAKNGKKTQSFLQEIATAPEFKKNLFRSIATPLLKDAGFDVNNTYVLRIAAKDADLEKIKTELESSIQNITQLLGEMDVLLDGIRKNAPKDKDGKTPFDLAEEKRNDTQE